MAVIFLNGTVYGHDTADHILSNIQSIYGPGGAIYFHLTFLKRLISWSFNFDQRVSGAIDYSFVVSSAYSTFSAGYVIYQVFDFPVKLYGQPDMSPVELARRFAALEAPLLVSQMSIAYAIVQFLLCSYYACAKRGVWNAVAGLMCVLAHFIVQLKWHSLSGGGAYPFTQSYLGTSGWLASIMLILFSVLSGILIALLIKHANKPRLNGDSDWWPKQYVTLYKRSRELQMCVGISVPFSLVEAGVLALVMSGALTQRFAVSTVLAPRNLSTRIWCLLVPPSPTPISNLDQTIMILKGLVGLGWAVWSAVKSRSEKGGEATRSQESTQAERCASEVLHMGELPLFHRSDFSFCSYKCTHAPISGDIRA